MNETSNETLLLQFSGRDRPGLTALLTALLAEYDACILDIGQAVVHRTLALGLLIEIPRGESLASLENALMTKSAELELQVRMSPVGKAELDHWIAAQGQDRFIITVLGRAISARHLSLVSGILTEHGLNVDRIERLSGRMSLGGNSPSANACVELRVSGQATLRGRDAGRLPDHCHRISN